MIASLTTTAWLGRVADVERKADMMGLGPNGRDLGWRGWGSGLGRLGLEFGGAKPGREKNEGVKKREFHGGQGW